MWELGSIQGCTTSQNNTGYTIKFINSKTVDTEKYYYKRIFLEAWYSH